MDTHVRAHLDDDNLEHSFAMHAAQERGALASLLADIAEIDARHLDRAAKSIQVARVACELPALFPAIADGRMGRSTRSRY